MEAPPGVDAGRFAWRLAWTLFFLLVNGFFVAAEFALVKVRTARIDALAESGSSRAQAVRHILEHLDRYLSACQLGITIASLVLGWLAEPAIAELLLALLGAAGWEVDPGHPALHGAALAVALSIVTLLHMTVGEQAPKLWAIERAETAALRIAHPLRVFTQVFHPFIWLVNACSNLLLRSVGLSRGEVEESSAQSAEELKWVLSASARRGQISGRQLELAHNVIDIIGLEVRHIMVPRVDLEYLSLERRIEDNLRIVRESGHSRFPVCAVGLDTVVGIVHAKQVMSLLCDGSEVDLQKLAQRPLFVSDTQPLSRLIFQLRRARTHVCVVLDEHGTTVGMAFLEDALEEIVGPIQDEFDQEEAEIRFLGSGSVEVPGSLSLPEAAGELELGELTEATDTIGGYVVALLGRLPRRGDRLRIGRWDVTVKRVERRRIKELLFEPAEREGAGGAPD